jgi:pyruvate/2-oxoglutarate dehydrogenase complex dihydrolipoamide acyltransferase (E2) component
MSQLIEVTVPDIGDYTDVPVIDICVIVGDVVKVDDALVTLESDKATMDVPSSAAGVVREIRVALGERISAGAVVVVLEASEQAAATPVAAAPACRPSCGASAGCCRGSSGGSPCWRSGRGQGARHW